MSILIVSGDIGGAKAVGAVLSMLSDYTKDFYVVRHREFNISNNDWKTIDIEIINENTWSLVFDTLDIKILLWSTSVSDIFPLRLARKAKELGVYVICLLDNWMNYKFRLEIDGEKPLIPDCYMVMDQLAYDEAIRDGIPENILKITGNPALASINSEYRKYCNSYRCIKSEELSIGSKKLVVFISEPAEMDQGSDNTFPNFRGYTEKTVLKHFCENMQSYADEIYIGIISHPRENKEELLKSWDCYRGKLEGGCINVKNGREAVFLADGVSGMTSILLYESWLLNKPTLSLQPNIQNDSLRALEKRKGIVCLVDNSQWHEKILKWCDKVKGFITEICKKLQYIIDKFSY